MTAPELGLALRAGDFASAANLVSRAPDGTGSLGLLFPLYSLVGHALELAYKSILVADGMSVEEVKREFSHNVAKCRAESVERLPDVIADLEDDDDRIAALVALLSPYLDARDKRLNYMVRGPMSLPEVHYVEDVSAFVGNTYKWVDRAVRKKLGVVALQPLEMRAEEDEDDS